MTNGRSSSLQVSAKAQKHQHTFSNKNSLHNVAVGNSMTFNYGNSVPSSPLLDTPSYPMHGDLDGPNSSPLLVQKPYIGDLDDLSSKLLVLSSHHRAQASITSAQSSNYGKEFDARDYLGGGNTVNQKLHDLELEKDGLGKTNEDLL